MYDYGIYICDPILNVDDHNLLTPRNKYTTKKVYSVFSVLTVLFPDFTKPLTYFF